jgi:hypothetical protein
VKKKKRRRRSREQEKEDNEERRRRVKRRENEEKRREGERRMGQLHGSGLQILYSILHFNEYYIGSRFYILVFLLHY